MTLSSLKPAFLSHLDVYSDLCAGGIILLKYHCFPLRQWLVFQPRNEVFVKELTVGCRINFFPQFNLERSNTDIFFDPRPKHYPIHCFADNESQLLVDDRSVSNLMLNHPAHRYLRNTLEICLHMPVRPFYPFAFVIFAQLRLFLWFQ